MSPSDTPCSSEPAQAAEERPATDGAPHPDAPPSPKPYRSPRLVSYGRLTEITRFGGSQIVDSGNNLGNLQ